MSWGGRPRSLRKRPRPAAAVGLSSPRLMCAKMNKSERTRNRRNRSLAPHEHLYYKEYKIQQEANLPLRRCALLSSYRRYHYGARFSEVSRVADVDRALVRRSLHALFYSRYPPANFAAPTTLCPRLAAATAPSAHHHPPPPVNARNRKRCRRPIISIWSNDAPTRAGRPSPPFTAHRVYDRRSASARSAVWALE